VRGPVTLTFELSTRKLHCRVHARLFACHAHGVLIINVEQAVTLVADLTAAEDSDQDVNSGLQVQLKEDGVTGQEGTGRMHLVCDLCFCSMSRVRFKRGVQPHCGARTKKL